MWGNLERVRCKKQECNQICSTRQCLEKLMFSLLLEETLLFCFGADGVRGGGLHSSPSLFIQEAYYHVQVLFASGWCVYIYNSPSQEVLT